MKKPEAFSNSCVDAKLVSRQPHQRLEVMYCLNFVQELTLRQFDFDAREIRGSLPS